MTCAPFTVVRARAAELAFPAREDCVALRRTEAEDCVCRMYPGAGFYVVGTCGHAHGWNLRRADAGAQAKRLALMQEVS